MIFGCTLIGEKNIRGTFGTFCLVSTIRPSLIYPGRGPRATSCGLHACCLSGIGQLRCWLMCWSTGWLVDVMITNKCNFNQKGSRADLSESCRNFKDYIIKPTNIPGCRTARWKLCTAKWSQLMIRRLEDEKKCYYFTLFFGSRLDRTKAD